MLQLPNKEIYLEVNTDENNYMNTTGNENSEQCHNITLINYLEVYKN